MYIDTSYTFESNGPKCLFRLALTWSRSKYELKDKWIFKDSLRKVNKK